MPTAPPDATIYVTIDDFVRVEERVVQLIQLTEDYQARIVELEKRSHSTTIMHIGTIEMGDKKIEIHGNQNQANLADRGANITAKQSFKGPDEKLTKDEILALINGAQGAVDNHQDKLDAIHSLAFDGLSDVLLQLKKLRLDLKTTSEVQQKAKDTIDELWAKKFAEDAKPPSLAKLTELLTALAPLIGDIGVKVLAA
jgi:hypothetical protein